MAWIPRQSQIQNIPLNANFLIVAATFDLPSFEKWIDEIFVENVAELEVGDVEVFALFDQFSYLLHNFVICQDYRGLKSLIDLFVYILIFLNFPLSHHWRCRNPRFNLGEWPTAYIKWFIINFEVDDRLIFWIIHDFCLNAHDVLSNWATLLRFKFASSILLRREIFSLARPFRCTVLIKRELKWVFN